MTIDDDQIQHEVMRLLRIARPLVGGQLRPVPVDKADVVLFESAHRVSLPEELCSWLSHCNGAPVNPGGIYPLIARHHDDVSIDWYLSSYPKWVSRGWWPIASDGCGDVYMLTTELVSPRGTHPVFFLDQVNWDEPAYLVASGLWRFLKFFVESGIHGDSGGAIRWPFDRKFVLAEDPDLVAFRGIHLPWDVVDA